MGEEAGGEEGDGGDVDGEEGDGGEAEREDEAEGDDEAEDPGDEEASGAAGSGTARAASRRSGMEARIEARIDPDMSRIPPSCNKMPAGCEPRNGSIHDPRRGGGQGLGLRRAGTPRSTTPRGAEAVQYQAIKRGGAIGRWRSAAAGAPLAAGLVRNLPGAGRPLQRFAMPLVALSEPCLNEL